MRTARKIPRGIADARLLLAARLLLNNLAQDADSVRFNRLRKFNVLDNVEPALT